METKLNIYQRVNMIMRGLRNIVQEDKLVNGQYPFVSHDTLTKTLQPHLVKHGVVVVPTVTEYTQNGNRTEITVRIELVNIDNPVDRYGFNAIGYGLDSQDKGPGKAISYAVKNGLLKAFQLKSGDKDVEADTTTDHQPDKKTMTKPPTAVEGKSEDARRHETLLRRAEKKGMDKNALTKWLYGFYQLESIEGVTADNFQEIVTAVNALDKFEVEGNKIIEEQDDIPF